MHDVAVFGVASEDVGDDFAESLWEDSLVDVLDGVVHVFLRCAHTAHHVSLVVVNRHFSMLFLSICWFYAAKVVKN